MSKVAAIVSALLVASCAAHRSEMDSVAADPVPTPRSAGPALTSAADSTATAEAPLPEAAEAKTVEISELDNGLICESRPRTGSRISRNVCYTREERAALQAANREQAQRYAYELARDQELREAQQRALEEQRRQQMIGIMTGGQ